VTRLRSARKAAGLSQEALAIKAGVSQGFLALLERGYSPKHGPKLDAIADALDLETAQVFPAPIEDDRLPAELRA
jgi:transcriptional regulator with XRE-family HTH domain